jgi:hypothetical protein
MHIFQMFSRTLRILNLLFDGVKRPLSTAGKPTRAIRKKRDLTYVKRWFKRGWTLQELLAPPMIRFFSYEWDCIGDRDSLRPDISAQTDIGEEYLTGRPLSRASIAKRMSWASSRETTRPEDLAYCLLGIFDVNMPLLYGEGQNAFIRLQEEIMKISDDQTIFSWDYARITPEQNFGLNIALNLGNRKGLLATRPAAFKQCSHIIPDEVGEPRKPYIMTNMGLQIELPLVLLPQTSRHPFAILACSYTGDILSLLALPVLKVNDYQYSRQGDPFLIHRDEIVGAQKRTIYLLRDQSITIRSTYERRLGPPDQFIVRRLPQMESKFQIWKVEPGDIWDSKQRIISKATGTSSVVIRLREGHGEGVVIILPHASSRDYTYFRCKVFWETTIQPFKYGTSAAHHMQQAHLHRQLDRFQITIGEPKQIASGAVICTIDIDVNIGESDAERVMEHTRPGYKVWKGPKIVYPSAFSPIEGEGLEDVKEAEIDDTEGYDEQSKQESEVEKKTGLIADLLLEID